MDNTPHPLNFLDVNQIIAAFDSKGDLSFASKPFEYLKQVSDKRPDKVIDHLRQCAIRSISSNERITQVPLSSLSAEMVPVVIDGIQHAILWSPQIANNEALETNVNLLRRLKLLAKHSTSVTILFRPDGSRSYISPSALKIFGYSATELLQKHPEHGILDPYKEGYRAYMEDVKQGRATKDGYELRFEKKDGSIAWLHIELDLIHSDDGAKTYVQSSVNDISLRKTYELELEETKAGAVAILNTSDSALLLISKDHHIISANDRAKMLSHKFFREPVKKGDLTLGVLPQKWHADYLARFEKALAGQESKVVQMLDFKRLKKPLWFQFKYTPVWLPDGSVTAVSWTATDITDQRKTEDYTFSLLERLNLANNAADIGIWEYDFEQDHTKFDDKCIWLYENKLGVQVSRKEWFSCYISKSEKALNKILDPRASREKKDFDVILQLNDQIHEAEFHHIKGQIQFYDGKPTKAVGVVMDVSKAKQVELKLEQSHYKLNVAQKMAKLGSFEFDVKSNTIEWTENTFNIHGIDNDQVPTIKEYIGKIHEDDREKFIDLMRTTARKNGAQQLTYRLSVNGTEHTFNAIFKGHFYRNKLHRIIGTIQDITDNISLIETLDKQKAELDESSKRISSYSFANSHKLRAPLSNILGLIQILKIEPSDEMFDMLERSADDLDGVIHEINTLLAD